MTFPSLARKRLALLTLPLIAFTLTLSSYHPAPVSAANPTADPVADYAVQIDRLVRDHKLADLADLSIPDGTPTAKLNEWKQHYVSELKQSDALRTKEYEDDVTKAQDYISKNKFERAIEEAVSAYMVSKDQPAFLKLPWLQDLTNKVAKAASDYEKSGRWLESLQLYTDLNTLYEIDTRYKSDMQRLARRVRLLALYTPKTLFDMRKSISARYEKERAETQPGTQPATQTAEDKEPPSFPRWQDHVEGATRDMLQTAIDRARTAWVEGTTYKTLLRGGVDALRLFLTTPELAKEFPGLADENAKAKFATALNSAFAQVANLAHDEDLKASDMRRIVADVLDANRDTIKLPNEVAIMEFTDGAMEKLDPFTAVIWPSELAEFEKNTQGEFGGVGIQISLESNQLKVISPLEETPAIRAGIEAGDVITAIDGQSTVGITIDQAVHRIMGKPDTQVKLSVRRPGKVDPVDFTLTRALIKVTSVKGYKRDPNDPSKWLHMIDPNNQIGYVRVTGFQKDTAKELRSTIEALKEQGVRGLILDLRFNPGGLLTAATEMSDMFISDPKAVIVSTKGLRVREQITRAHGNAILADSVPVVVLVNQYSASASEIFSGALKDLKRALIIGQRSFGKGSVQNVVPIDDDNKAYIKLTMSYYYLPEGESLHRRDGAKSWGVEPDVVMDMTPAQIQALIKARRDADIIAKNGNPATTPATAPATANGRERPFEPLIDTQLDTALLMLRLQTIQPRG